MRVSGAAYINKKGNLYDGALNKCYQYTLEERIFCFISYRTLLAVVTPAMRLARRMWR